MENETITDTTPRASYGLSLLVALGWYLVVVAAVAADILSSPATPHDDCTALFSCMTPTQTLILLLVFVGGPVLGVLFIVTLLVTAPIARAVRSPIAAGTLSALASAALAGVAVAVYLAAK